MATIHFMLQAKGGVGKSVISNIFYQCIRHQGLQVQGFDTDPSNPTFANFKDLEVKEINLIFDGEINQRGFDPLIDEINQLPPDAHAVIDNGASSFISFCSYLAENEIFYNLQTPEFGSHQVYIHTVICGGQAMIDTLNSLRTLAVTFRYIPIVIWLNRFFGDITMDGKGFEEFKIYDEYSSSFHAIITPPNRKMATFGKDLSELLARRQSFNEAIHDKSLSIIVRQRLITIWHEYINEISNAGLY